jgi:hypothetical protein
VNTERAYSTSDPAIVAAYRQACADRTATGKRIAAAVADLGAGPRVFVRSLGFGGPDRITAIEQSGDHVPDGWRVVRGNLEPRRGTPGEVARQWLADHQPVDVRGVMEAHGLPRACWIPRDREFGWTVSRPKLFEHDATVWACYETEPGTADSGFDTDRCTWEPRPLSEFYAAWEAHEATTAEQGGEGR